MALKRSKKDLQFRSKCIEFLMKLETSCFAERRQKMRKLSLALSVALLAATATFAQARDGAEAKFGVLFKILPMSYNEVWSNLEFSPFMGPPAINIHYQEIGIVWHISPLIALKPTFLINFPGYVASESGIDVQELKAHIIGATAALDFTFQRRGDVTLFAGPLFRFLTFYYGWEDLTTPGNSYDVGGFEASAIAALGGQYMLGNRFGLWGRGGIGFTYLKVGYREYFGGIEGDTAELEGSVIFTYQGSLGVVFYIK
jgi:hypothetical protein